MNIFKSLGRELSYTDIFQLDGAFAITHINYGKSPIFNGVDGKDIAKVSRENSLSSEETIYNVLDIIGSFDGTEKDFSTDDRIELWKEYWLEYINAFDKMTNALPNSIVTAYIGRQAIELGFKYLLLKKTGKIIRTHYLKVLSNELFSEYDIHESYMEWVNEFCESYGEYIEGTNVEYFRFPEYKQNRFFAGNKLDISWLSFNFALVLLKLLHFADLDAEFEK